jgi:glycogen debranching enzyme
LPILAASSIDRQDAMQRLAMSPGTGERVLRFVGDRITFKLHGAEGQPLPPGWRGMLRTNIGRGDVLRNGIIHAHTGELKLTDAAWRDIALQPQAGEWVLDLPLTEAGYFQAKAYAVDAHGWQHWPDGYDVGIGVHPSRYRTANTIYCAFVRMFGETKSAVRTADDKLEPVLGALDKLGYTVIPPSGKFRDLVQSLPHILGTLGCRILHLLPVNPTPTVYAKFGRFGSPYALQDLLAIDPALVEFDKRTTSIDQFRELTYETHRLGGRLFLDVVINHTGWGSSLQENHPEWFMRDAKGNFVSPGAWGVTWEDLVELNQQQRELWEHLGDVFLEWCRRGVDGFRCDAGYKIPVPAWRYITARVLDEFPETVFLLEGLGGAWEATESLLTEGGMQWAYSELFQNYSGPDVAKYLDYSSRQSERVGLYVHYSETHDNDRLAARGRAWSLLRNRLCALTGASGGFGFTCGVEWLASEKVQVHQSRGMAWGNPQNLVQELAALNRLLATHPCFFDGATLRRISPAESPVYALSRTSQEGRDRVLVLVNTDAEKAHRLALEEAEYQALGRPAVDLLGQPAPPMRADGEGRIEFSLEPAASFCLAASPEPEGLSGDLYRERRAQAAWALGAVTKRFRAKDIGAYDWQALADLAAADPRRFLAAVNRLDAEGVRRDLCDALREALGTESYPQVVRWKLLDRQRVLPVPAEHWLLVENNAPFRVMLKPAGAQHPQHLTSTLMRGAHVACFAPGQFGGEASLVLERYAEENPRVEARVLFLTAEPGQADGEPPVPAPDALALLTNGLGGMARLRVDLGTVQSKYDCLLGANLHPSAPVDRHIFAKRVRVWVNADGFLEPLRHTNLLEFAAGPPAQWRFVASTGDSRAVEIVLTADMIQGRNTTVLGFHRPAGALPFGRELPASARVYLVVRLDIEDRNFHAETHRNGGADHHFTTLSRPLDQGIGFEFTPAADRHLRAFCDTGLYHHEAEWSVGVPHPVEATRGQVAQGDGFSPGWFELPLGKGQSVTLTVSADATEPAPEELASFANRRRADLAQAVARADRPAEDSFGQRLTQAVQAFVVRRGAGKTVIAGYPWFLDWGRDSLVCARGLLAAKMTDTVKELLVLFGGFEEGGTLPNSIHGEDASNRDTSDAPLWFGIVCEELATLEGDATYQLQVGRDGRTILDVLRRIARGYRQGTPGGIRLDAESGLIWSPSHFTWMDTSFPACTPREGYPVEIQALWIRLLRQLARLHGKGDSEPWEELASRAEASLLKLFWLEAKGYFADLLSAKPGQPAAQAAVDDVLRCNSLLVISLGLARGDRARRSVDQALEHLVVPGALRSLAPLPVALPLPLVIHNADGQWLNQPREPYWGRYEGDEDTHRKPAYHNGTAWTWLLPVFCEALAEAWDFHPTAVSAAESCLSSVERLLVGGCLGHLPEIVDGDAPHVARGCDAQAWSITEALRVWTRLRARPQP